MQHMAQPTDEHRKLHRLAGTWHSEETMHPSPWDPKGGGAIGISEVKPVLDGFFVETHYRQERGGQVTYRGLGLFGFDPKAQKYTMLWFDNMGAGCGGAPAFGTFDGDRLVFQNEPWPGTQTRYVYDFESDNRYRFRLENSQDGGKTWSPFIESVSTKK